MDIYTEMSRTLDETIRAGTEASSAMKAAEIELDRRADRITALEHDVAHKDSVIRSYREQNAHHEKLVGQLLKLLDDDDLDGARDLVKYEHDGIHGPRD